MIVANCCQAGETSIAVFLGTLKNVGPDNAGRAKALVARERLAEANARDLPEILAGLDDAPPLAANWIRNAIDRIADRCDKSWPPPARSVHGGDILPRAELERFIFDRSHAPRARRLAYEILLPGDRELPDRVLPKMLDDPSLELRRDAVARILAWADDQPERDSVVRERAIGEYQKAFDAALDLDQVKHAAGRLSHFGRSVDLPQHFGFITTWHVVGPFDNRNTKGFAHAYPPENQVDFAAGYDGKDADVKWHEFVTNDSYGQVDLNRAIGKHLGAVAYAAAEFESDRERDVELRLGTENACKLWLNGKLLLESEVYHSFTSMDQFVGRGAMKKGRNLILLKICQNEQTEDWAQVWQFQLRVCESSGTAILSRERAAKFEEGGRR